jgi:hypothetical protein
LGALHGKTFKIHLVNDCKRFMHTPILPVWRKGNAQIAAGLLDAQAGDCTSNHQLLNFRGALKDGVNLRKYCRTAHQSRL